MIDLKKKCKLVKESIMKNNWLSGIDRVEFLAAGEYNENFKVVSGPGTYVFRINHGSQLNLENQIEYEFRVLKAVQASGVTPVPYFYSLYDDFFHTGILLMEYCPGGAFDYVLHKDRAAYIFAQIHNLPVSAELLRQENPVMDIARESLSLIMRYKEHPLLDIKKRLFAYYDEICELGRQHANLFHNEPFCIVNTEVNSGNFIVDKKKTYLVDWEKAVVSYRYQDLGHFLVPTTTLWKSGYTYSREEKKEFLLQYTKNLELDQDCDELLEKTGIMEKVILLRALSWCFMAYYEYTGLNRTLQNRYTFNKITSYLKDMEWFLQ